MKFLDQAKIFIQSGNGGGGCVSFRREAHVPRGGPDGGNGGKGGNIIAKCVDSLNTLIDYRYQQHFKAQPGRPGAGRNRSGMNGENITLKLPVGTQVLTEDGDIVLADLTEVGQEITLARGGDGGHGNAAFKSSTNQAPRRADKGYAGMGMWIWLRLKLIADAGLVGLPNAGKSTFLAATSAARPKIADYPFTTTNPNLGVVAVHDNEFIMADIPGLVEGAHEGIGLGHRFLGHVERCQVLVHLVDGTATDPVADWQVIRGELMAYSESLMNKHIITAISKTDALDDEQIEAIKHALITVGAENVTAVSAVSKKGLTMLLQNIYTTITASKKTVEIQEQWQP